MVSGTLREEPLRRFSDKPLNKNISICWSLTGLISTVVNICYQCDWIYADIHVSPVNIDGGAHIYIYIIIVYIYTYIRIHTHTIYTYIPITVTSLQIWAAGYWGTSEFPLESGWFRTLRKQLMMQWRPLGVEKSLTLGSKCINMLLYLSRRWEVFPFPCLLLRKKERYHPKNVAAITDQKKNTISSGLKIFLELRVSSWELARSSLVGMQRRDEALENVQKALEEQSEAIIRRRWYGICRIMLYETHESMNKTRPV